MDSFRRFLSCKSGAGAPRANLLSIKTFTPPTPKPRQMRFNHTGRGLFLSLSDSLRKAKAEFHFFIP